MIYSKATWEGGKVISLHNPSVQFSSFAQSCLTLCDPTNRSTPGLPVHPGVHPNPCPSSRWFLLSIWGVSGYFPLGSLFLWCLYMRSLCFSWLGFSNVLTLSLPFCFFQMSSILSENLSESKWKLLRLADKYKKINFFNVYLAAPGLSCGMWDLVPRLEIEPGPPALGGWVSATRSPEKSNNESFNTGDRKASKKRVKSTC